MPPPREETTPDGAGHGRGQCGTRLRGERIAGNDTEYALRPRAGSADVARRPAGSASVVPRPDSIEEMVTKIGQVPSTEPGIYRFKAKLTMAGG